MRIRKLEKMYSVICSMNVRAANVGVTLGITPNVDASAQIGARQHLANVPRSPVTFVSLATRQAQSLS